jgi:hypothetical protein
LGLLPQVPIGIFIGFYSEKTSCFFSFEGQICLQVVKAISYFTKSLTIFMATDNLYQLGKSLAIVNKFLLPFCYTQASFWPHVDMLQNV